MPVFHLSKSNIFPNPELSNADGLLAVGGDLSVERLLAAYSKGIFPWYSENGIPFWFSPTQRCVVFLNALHISHSMKKLFRQKKFTVTSDTDFKSVILACAQVERKNDTGTWISPDFIEAYTQLHYEGFAHSVEVWHQGSLAGGIYGVSLGKCFFGESMFSSISNASKYAFIHLAQILKQHNFSFIDCQIHNPHLTTLGAEIIDRNTFLQQLHLALKHPTIKGKWDFLNSV